MHKLLKSPSLISMFVLGGGNIIGTVISAITLIIFSRVLGPAQFGLFSAVFALMQIVVKLIDVGTTTAAERTLARAHSQNPSKTNSILLAAGYIKAGLYIIWSFIGLASADFLAHDYLKIDNTLLVKQAILLSLGTVIFEYSTIAFQSASKFVLVARITLAQALGKLIGGMLLLISGSLSATTAIWLYGVMPAIGTIAGWINNPIKFALSFEKSWHIEARQIMSVAKWTGVAAIAATLADNLDTLIIQSMLNLHETGIWSAAARIAAFASIIPWTIGSVLSIRVTSFRQKSHISQYIKKAKIVALGSATLILLAIPFSRLALEITVGHEYLAGTVPLMLMLVATALTAMNSPFASLFYLFEKPQYYAYVGIISTILLVSLDYLLIPIFGINGAGITRIVMRLTILSFTLVYARYSYKNHTTDKY